MHSADESSFSVCVRRLECLPGSQGRGKGCDKELIASYMCWKEGLGATLFSLKLIKMCACNVISTASISIESFIMCFCRTSDILFFL